MLVRHVLSQLSYAPSTAAVAVFLYCISDGCYYTHTPPFCQALIQNFSIFLSEACQQGFDLLRRELVDGIAELALDMDGFPLIHDLLQILPADSDQRGGHALT